MKLTFLGTGTSNGVPTIGCTCEVCQSKDPKDNRLRCAALLESDTTRILIDCGPDIRSQLLRVPFQKIDGVLLTHEHYDHVGGIDDLRPCCVFGEIPLYGNCRTVEAVRRNMPYCFTDKPYPGSPKLSLHTVEPLQAFHLHDLEILPLEVMHGPAPILAYRVGSFAYITDMKTMEIPSFHALKGVKTLVVNALRFQRPHFSHQLVEDAVDFSRKIGAKKTYLIHMNHEIGLHEEAQKKLPENIMFAYDGLCVDV